MTLEVLKNIRDDIRSINKSVDALGTRLDDTNMRLDRIEREAEETNKHLQRLEDRLIANEGDLEGRMQAQLVEVRRRLSALEKTPRSRRR